MLGYEIATRAGIALHSSAREFHCSGAWNALGCAAIGARLLGLDHERTRHALGIAEYFGPRGQIMRACDHPSMVKDGSGWGAHAGVSAALLAAEDFTGAPALTIEGDDTAPFFGDLGSRWRICEQYFKAYPVCRWAQPAIEAALELQRAHGFAAADIVKIGIESFHEAVALGSQCPMPRATDEAQYSLPFPVAAALVFGHVGADEVGALGLDNAQVARLVAATTVDEDHAFSDRFPAERWARVRITLQDGRALVSNPARARGNPENPLSDDELRAKYRELAAPVLGARTRSEDRAGRRCARERRGCAAVAARGPAAALGRLEREPVSTRAARYGVSAISPASPDGRGPGSATSRRRIATLSSPTLTLTCGHPNGAFASTKPTVAVSRAMFAAAPTLAGCQGKLPRIQSQTSFVSAGRVVTSKRRDCHTPNPESGISRTRIRGLSNER